MNRWIFVFKGSDSEFRSKVNTGLWEIFKKTPNREKLAVGDSIVFYKAGTDGKKFIGSASIMTGLKELTPSKYFLEMKNVSVWENQVAVIHIIEKLDFIKNKKNWGNYFQGGVRSISEHDLLAIANHDSTES